MHLALLLVNALLLSQLLLFLHVHSHVGEVRALRHLIQGLVPVAFADVEALLSHQLLWGLGIGVLLVDQHFNLLPLDILGDLFPLLKLLIFSKRRFFLWSDQSALVRESLHSSLSWLLPLSPLAGAKLDR